MAGCFVTTKYGRLRQCHCHKTKLAGVLDAEVALFFNRVAGGEEGYNSDGSPAGDFIGPCSKCGCNLMLKKPEGHPPSVACTGQAFPHHHDRTAHESTNQSDQRSKVLLLTRILTLLTGCSLELHHHCFGCLRVAMMLMLKQPEGHLPGAVWSVQFQFLTLKPV